jgi:response regulator RpfG family c-di-GMP phosphodiesterase
MNEPTVSGGGEAPRPRILLVDDEPNITTALQRELRAEPFALMAVNDARAALQAASEQEFDLIVSDNLMPEMTGLEFFSNLKVFHPHTRRVLLTGHTDLNRAVQAFNDGDIHRYVAKPWNREELLNIIRQELKIHREQKEEASSREQLQKAAEQRTSQLQEVFIELKQAKTQLALYEEGAALRGLHLSPRMRKLAVLVVDEHDGVREILVSTLKKTGIENVVGAASGARALNHLQASAQVDIILSEWKMVEMDGLTLFKAVRASNFQSANAPFILVTTRENRQAVEHAIQSGVNGYLIKPFHLKTLLDQIEGQLPKGELENLEERIRELRSLSYVVVNADLDSRSHLQNLLSASGAQNVAIAATGNKALRTIEEKMPDVLIYDCNIRDPYWIEMWERLRQAKAPGGRPAFVVTSVTPIQKEYEEVNRAGIGAFLPGQIHRRKLFQMVLKALDERGS